MQVLILLLTSQIFTRTNVRITLSSNLLLRAYAALRYPTDQSDRIHREAENNASKQEEASHIARLEANEAIDQSKRAPYDSAIAKKSNAKIRRAKMAEDVSRNAHLLADAAHDAVHDAAHKGRHHGAGRHHSARGRHGTAGYGAGAGQHGHGIARRGAAGYGIGKHSRSGHGASGRHSMLPHGDQNQHRIKANLKNRRIRPHAPRGARGHSKSSHAAHAVMHTELGGPLGPEPKIVVGFGDFAKNLKALQDAQAGAKMAGNPYASSYDTELMLRDAATGNAKAINGLEERNIIPEWLADEFLGLTRPSKRRQMKPITASDGPDVLQAVADQEKLNSLYHPEQKAAAEILASAPGGDVDTLFEVNGVLTGRTYEEEAERAIDEQQSREAAAKILASAPDGNTNAPFEVNGVPTGRTYMEEAQRARDQPQSRKTAAMILASAPGGDVDAPFEVDGVPTGRTYMEEARIAEAQLHFTPTLNSERASQALIDASRSPEPLVQDAILNDARVDSLRAGILEDLERQKDIKDELINKPLANASDLFLESKALKQEVIDEALANPVVREDILNGMDEAANEDHSQLKKAIKEAKKQDPPKTHTSALDFVERSNHERALMDEIENRDKENDLRLQEMEMDENMNNAKRAEESLALEVESKDIAHSGDMARDHVLDSGGSLEEAEEAAMVAEAKRKAELDAERAALVEKLAEAVPVHEAEHLALAHSGKNVTGESVGEIQDKLEAEKHREAALKKLLTNPSSSALGIKHVVNDDQPFVEVKDAHITLPLNNFIDEEAHTTDEAIAKENQAELRDALRNKVTANKVESGLNVVGLEDGYYTVPESAKNLKVEEGMAVFNSGAKATMEKKNQDTSLLEHKFNTGERNDIATGIGYYTADISGMSLELPSPSNPSPPSVVSNGKQSINLENAKFLKIDKGVINMTPWREYVKQIKPHAANISEDGLRAMEAKKAEEMAQKKAATLARTKAEVFTNPDGKEIVELTPEYGVTEHIDADEAVGSLNDVGPEFGLAISEIKDRKDAPLPLDMAEVPAMGHTETAFKDQALSKAKNLPESRDHINSVNAFNKMPISKKKEASQSSEAIIQGSVHTDGTVSSMIKNNLILSAAAFSSKLHMPEEQYISVVNMIPESTLNEMQQYLSTSVSTRQPMWSTTFYATLSSLVPSSSAHQLLEVVFSTISSVTGKPNTATGNILSKQVVTNAASNKVISGRKGAVAPGPNTTVGKTLSTHVVTNVAPNTAHNNGTTKTSPLPKEGHTNVLSSHVNTKKPGHDNLVPPSSRPAALLNGDVQDYKPPVSATKAPSNPPNGAKTNNAGPNHLHFYRVINVPPPQNH